MTEVLKGVTERITSRQFHGIDGVQDWRFVAGGACTYFRTGSFVAGARPHLVVVAERGDMA